MRLSRGRGDNVMRASSSKMFCLVLLLAAPACCIATESPIAASFTSFWHAAQGQSFTQQLQQWDSQIEAPRRELYNSVVWETQNDPRWRIRRERWLQARFAVYPKLAASIPDEVSALQSTIATQSIRFRELFPDADAHPPVEILLAPNFDAKSGMLSNGMPVLAFAADSLLLQQANLGIVVPHELFHLYHAQHAGISNDGVMPGVALTVPLLEEGLATYVSGQLSPGHTDGELLLQDDLGNIPASRLPYVATRFLDDAQYRAIDQEHPEVFKRWFNAAAKPYQQGLPNRSGYWLGLQLIRYLRHTYTLAQIAAWSPTHADMQVMSALKQISYNH
jgi:hypothetical protein